MGRGNEAGLVRLCDLAGRPRGTGFVADEHGTVVTSHEAVDGLARLVLHADAGAATCVVGADAVTALPEVDLALVRTEGLRVRPLPVSPRDGLAPGSYVRIAAGGWREARILGGAEVTYTATDRFHLIGTAVELAIGTAGSDALRLGGEAAGGPVTCSGTGAVLAVMGTALLAEHRSAGFAVPLRAAALADPGGPLDELLRRNAATVPGYGPDLNLAGVLQLTGTSVGSAGSGPAAFCEPVERPDVVRRIEDFVAGGSRVLGLVGDPGTGRTTELAALAARRARGTAPAPTVWLRGADLRATDGSVAEVMARVLDAAGRIVAATASAPDDPATPGVPREPDGRDGTDTGGDGPGREQVREHGHGHDQGQSQGPGPEATTPEAVARLAREAGRPLLLLLDGPEEMPPSLAHRLPAWTAATASWLEENGAQLVVACRPEHWQQAEALFPGRPPAVRLGDLTEAQAARARARHGIPDQALSPEDDRHPLSLRLLAELREALPGAPDGTPGREDLFTAHLDLMCLRVAVRLAAARDLRGTAVRRLAARVAGQAHEAARRCLGPGQGELDRESFEELFPWRTGWASAVLAEGLLVPAGTGYRFAHEEVADWLQAVHLDLDAALHALVHRWRTGDSALAEVPARLSSRPGTSPPVPPAPSRRRARRAGRTVRTGVERPGGTVAGPGEPETLPVPRHRIGPVVQALLLLARRRGPAELAARLVELAAATAELAVTTRPVRPDPPVRSDRSDPSVRPDCPDRPVRSDPSVRPDRSGRCTEAAWWASWLLAEVLVRVPDATPYLGVLRMLADRAPAAGSTGPSDAFAVDFWLRVRVAPADRIDLLRRRLPSDGGPREHAGEAHPPDGPSTPGEPAGPGGPGGPEGGGPSGAPVSRFRCLDAVAGLLAADPRAVQPLLCRWFADDRPLAAAPGATVATAAQALLHTHRHRAADDLTEALVTAAHPRADELLTELAAEEPAALCRAVLRWARDERPGRRAAAAAYGLRVAPHAGEEADRRLLREAALALFAQDADTTLHGPALALLVRDPVTRARHLPRAVRRFAEGDAGLPAEALAAALPSHPEPVLAAFRARLRSGDEAADVLRTLAGLTGPVLARRASALVAEHLAARPEAARSVAAYVGHRLGQGPGARDHLHPFVCDLLRTQPAPVRAALAAELAASGPGRSEPLRAELLEILLAYERYAMPDPAVPGAVLAAVGAACPTVRGPVLRDLVLRAGRLLVRTPDGATHFDRRLVQLARRRPEFAVLLIGWLEADPRGWAALVGPSARRTVENLAERFPGAA